MKVTRDVIYDLLPAYFAGEISADSKTLIDEFFASDPEFGRMAERFRTLQQDMTAGPADDSEIDREREAFGRARNQFRKQKIATMWAVGAAVALLMIALTPTQNGPTLIHPGTAISVVCAWMAAATWLSSRRIDTRTAQVTEEITLSRGRLKRRKRRANGHV